MGPRRGRGHGGPSAARGTPVLHRLAGPHCSTQHRLATLATVTLADLTQEAWVLREPGSASRHVVEQALRAHQMPWQLRLALPSNEAIKQAVMAGVGIGMVSRLAVTLEAQEGWLHIVSVRDFQVERQLSIVQRKDARLPAPAVAFLSLLYQPF
jgi:DNA-binding transcriptional LysR family regulator